jgi:light-regulated signal transduction histidine kinase (bacteriophytochrome)
MRDRSKTKDELVRELVRLRGRISKLKAVETHHKETEEEIRNLNQDLERRTVELEAANKELEAFTYSVSHDLRAPLVAIGGFSRLILEKCADHLDAKGQHFLEIIHSNSERMLQLIDDLIAFSHLEHQEIKALDINMEELAKSVFEALKPLHPGRPLALKLKRLPVARGDPGMIRQVLVNLLSNAMKFTRPKEDGSVEMGCLVHENRRVYYVKDNGVGFDMRHADRLFSVFQRLHDPQEFEGTGIGLAIVQRIIDRHGGWVWAEGKVNEGATFYFTLPGGP